MDEELVGSWKREDGRQETKEGSLMMDAPCVIEAKMTNDQ